MKAEFDVSGCGGVLIRERATDLIRKIISVNAEAEAKKREGKGEGKGEGSLRTAEGTETESAGKHMRRVMICVKFVGYYSISKNDFQKEGGVRG